MTGSQQRKSNILDHHQMLCFEIIRASGQIADQRDRILLSIILDHNMHLMLSGDWDPDHFILASYDVPGQRLIFYNN